MAPGGDVWKGSYIEPAWTLAKMWNQMRDSGALEASRAAFWKAKASCVSENLARLPKQAAFL